MKKDLVMNFGDATDGVIGIPCITDDGHVVEASYFFGDKKPKNIICISSQVSCPMRCEFCELGAERFVRNLTPAEMLLQVVMVLQEAAKLGFYVNMPHKITIANSGEPLLNPSLLDGLELLNGFGTSFKISTIVPKGAKVLERVADIAAFAATCLQPIQLQISLISTDESERIRISGGGASDFATVKRVAEIWRSKNPNGRKVNLSLILTEESIFNIEHVVNQFPAELFRFRFREYVPTVNGTSHQLSRISAERLLSIKGQFRTYGYDVHDDATPTSTEQKFGLVANSIRRMYLEMSSHAAR